MNREVRGFLMGLLVAAVVVLSVATFGASEGRYRLTVPNDAPGAFIVDTETGKVYVVGPSGYLYIGSPETAKDYPAQ